MTTLIAGNTVLDEGYRHVELRRVCFDIPNPAPDRRMRAWSAAAVIATGTVVEYHKPTDDSNERAYFRRGYSTNNVYEGVPLFDLLLTHSQPIPYSVHDLFTVCNIGERGAAYIVQRFIANGWCGLADVVDAIDAWNEEDD